jgi:hypothetical protein
VEENKKILTAESAEDAEMLKNKLVIPAQAGIQEPEVRMRWIVIPRLAGPTPECGGYEE